MLNTQKNTPLVIKPLGISAADLDSIFILPYNWTGDQNDESLSCSLNSVLKVQTMSRCPLWAVDSIFLYSVAAAQAGIIQ